MVEYAVVYILLDYLSDASVNQNLAKATAIINFQDGLSTVSTVIVAHIADSCLGRDDAEKITSEPYGSNMLDTRPA